MTPFAAPSDLQPILQRWELPDETHGRDGVDGE